MLMCIEMRGLLASGMVVLLVLAVALFVVPIFVPWTTLNCQHQEIDIRTGRTRISTYLAFCKVSERVMASRISSVLPNELIVTTQPDWKLVNTFSPEIGHSPHYRFHGAFSRIHDLEFLWQAANADQLTRRKTVEHLLALWQFDGDDYLARRYIDALRDLEDSGKREPLVRSIKGLEMPEERPEGDHSVLTLFFPVGRPMERVHGYRQATGQFVRDGPWESWHANGKRRSYRHLDHGQLHEPSFKWDDDGKLTCIQSFNHDELVGYESTNLASRPEYAEAQRIAAEP
jgi:hypothetical protein